MDGSPQPRSGNFLKEEIPTKLGYPVDYLPGVNSLRYQAAWFGKAFKLPFPVFKDPTLDEVDCAVSDSHPFRHWYVVPRWQAVAPSCGAAIKLACELLALGRTFEGPLPEGLDPSDGPLFEYHSFQNVEDETQSWLDGLQRDMDNNFVLMKVQFGAEHRGRSIRRTQEVLEDNEFFLDFFSILALLLLEPDRLSGCGKSLLLDCGGTTHPDLDNPGGFDLFPTIGANNKEVALMLAHASTVESDSAPVTAFREATWF